MNVRETKLSMPDYAGKSADDAVEDFLNRIRHYESVYETLTEEHLSFIKTIDVGRQLICNRVYGYLPWRIAFLVANLNTSPHTIYLVRHGQSEDNVLGRSLAPTIAHVAALEVIQISRRRGELSPSAFLNLLVVCLAKICRFGQAL